MAANQQAQYEKMIGTPIPRLVTKLAVPTIISMLITGIYNMADTYFVSCLKSDSATAAVGVVFSLMALIQAVGFTLGTGSGSQVSRLLGQQKNEEADRMVSSAFAGALIFGLALTVFGLCFLDELMGLLGSTDTILPYAREYARYILLGAPIMSGAFVLNICLRSAGYATLSMIGITTGGVLNMILDPVLIFGLDMGIAGAAVATLVSQCVSFVILLACFLRGKSVLKLSVRKISFRPALYWAIISTGMPSFCRQGLASIATVALNHAAMAYGDPAVAAMSVVSKVFMLIMSALIGFGQGYMPVLGYNYGAKRFDRVRQSFRFTILTSTVMMTALGTIGFVCAPWLLSFFGEGEMLDIAVVTMRAQCIGLAIDPVNVITNMTFQSIGKSGRATLLSSCRQGVFFLPLILIMPRLFGLVGMQITQMLADICSSLVCIPFLVVFFRKLPRGAE